MSHATSWRSAVRHWLVLMLVAGLAWLGAVHADQKLIMGIHPYLSAAQLHDRFNPLARYLSQALGKPLLIRVARDYQEHIERIGRGDVDIAFIGPSMYVNMIDLFGQKPLLARLEVNGKPFFQGVIITRSDSPIGKLQDLKHRSFAFGDEGSTMSHLLPRYVLSEAGIQLSDLSDHHFLGSHNNVALGVLTGDFDAGAVKEEVFEAFRDRGLKAVARTPPISEHLFVASPNLPEDQVTRIRELLLNLNEIPQGKAIMQAIKGTVTGLVPVSDTDYDLLRSYMEQVQKEMNKQ